MADYLPLMARAVAGLEKNSGENRRALYERVRLALTAQLRGVVPTLDESEITRERLALEEAIRKVENEAARQAREAVRFKSVDRSVSDPLAELASLIASDRPLLERTAQRTISPDFSNAVDAQHWLSGHRPEVAGVFASRAALRGIAALGYRGQSRGSLGEIVPALRAVSIAYAASVHGGNKNTSAHQILRGAASAAIGAYFANTPAVHAALSAVRIVRDDERSGVFHTLDAIRSADAAREGTRQIRSKNISRLFSIYEAATDDARITGHGIAADALALHPLWPGGVPNWVRDGWQQLSDPMLLADDDWDVWTTWYEARLNGGPVNQLLELARATLPDQVWQQEPKVLNAHIKRLISSPEQKLLEAIWGNAAQATPTEAVIEPPSVPARRPAAVEPFWNKGKLVVPTKPTKTNLSKAKFTAALSALRSELRELSDDVASDANIDRRFSSFLARLSDRIPKTIPPQDELFRLGHVEAVLTGYVKTVDEEWPDFLASRYHALLLQFDRTLRQSPLWREFQQNAAKKIHSDEQIAEAAMLALETATALRQNEALEFVEPSVPNSLEKLVEAVSAATDSSPQDAIEAGKELLAADLVESVNNTLKPIAEAALTTAADYAKGVGKGFRRAAKKQGPIDGEKAFKWLRRIVIGGALSGVGYGPFVALSQLITKYPESFAWLDRVLKFLAH